MYLNFLLFFPLDILGDFFVCFGWVGALGLGLGGGFFVVVEVFFNKINT